MAQAMRKVTCLDCGEAMFLFCVDRSSGVEGRDLLGYSCRQCKTETYYRRQELMARGIDGANPA